MIKIEKQLREFLVRAGHYTDKQGIAYRAAKGLNQIEQKRQQRRWQRSLPPPVPTDDRLGWECKLDDRANLYPIASIALQRV